MSQPNVKNYLDCFQYLQDIYQYNKLLRTDFSYQTWCYDLNVKSKSYLRFAVLGKRNISSELTLKLNKWLSLSQDDSEYFLLLVEYTQTEIPEIKRALSQKMIEKIKLDQTDHKKIQIQNANPLLIQIRDLLSFDDIQHNEESLARLFKQNQNVISEMLTKLEKMNLVQKSNTGFWKSTDKNIKIEDDHGNSILHEFHINSLKEALLHVKTNELQRKFRSLHLTLSEEEFQEFHKKISDHITILFNEYSQRSTSSGKKLYQINYNISPRTTMIE